eukprot:7441242-Pyramimonas_sp.AAC.1
MGKANGREHAMTDPDARGPPWNEGAQIRLASSRQRETPRMATRPTAAPSRGIWTASRRERWRAACRFEARTDARGGAVAIRAP